MNSSGESGDHKPCSSPSKSISSRNIQFFDVTGRRLVHPRSYTLQTFQKKIIETALLNNTLISLPPGLGKLFIAAVVTLNFHRWFLNSKILILSQTRSYLTDLLSAFNDYTSISKDVYAELLNNSLPKDYSSACKKPILLTSPQKLVELMKENAIKIQNVVLLIIFESNKLLKCQEYQQVLDALSEYEYRSLIFIDPIGFNPKTIRQVVAQFSISKFQVKNCDSEDIRECTFCSKIDHIIVDISNAISNMKDTFFAVLEKYSRILKDAKIISGNVTTLTKVQILKIKEKYKKNPPVNTSPTERENLMNSLTMCAFLCQGLEYLHNWGIRVFYGYLFDDDEKDPDVKTLIARDEDLRCQMKDLNKYLERSANKIDTAPLCVIHPKLIRLKEIVTQRFTKCETDADKVRIIIVCPFLIIDEIERFFCNLPDEIRYHCIKTTATCLANEPEHKEIVKTFMEGVINVLVLSNLVDEVFEIEASLIISLDLSKNLMKTSDPRFFKGTPECLFIVTRGTELIRFEELLKETKNEQKTLEVAGIEIFLQDSPRLFPGDFDPEFECSDVTEPKRNFKTSPVQKTIHRYLKPSQNHSSSPSIFETLSSPSVKKKEFSDVDSSISLFGETFQKSEFDAFDAINDDPIVLSPPPVNKRLEESYLIDPSNDLSDELIFDISKKVTPSSKCVTPETKRPNFENAKKSSLWSNKRSLFPSRKDKRHEPVTKPKMVITLDDDDNKKAPPASPMPDTKTKIPANTPPPINQIVTVAEVHWSPFDEEVAKKEASKIQNETFAEFLFSDSSSEDKQANQNEQKPAVVARPIDYDKIEVDTSFDAKAQLSESFFFDDLFVESDSESKPAPANKSEKTKDVDQADSDCDIIEDSPKAKRPCKVFSSRRIESVSSAASQASQTTSQRPKRRLYDDLKTNMSLNDSFDAIISDFPLDLVPNSSHNTKKDASARSVLDPKPPESCVMGSALSRPNSNAQNTPPSFSSTSNLPSERSVSPVLFSARTSSRERSSRMSSSSTFNQSSSIQFGSGLSGTENRSLRLNNHYSLASKRKSTTDSMLDDDDASFNNYNMSEIEQAAILRSVVDSSKDSGFQNASKSLKEYSASTPKTGTTKNVRTPEQSSTIRSNESTPDSLILDGYSTPENVFAGGAQRRPSDEDNVLRLRNSTPEANVVEFVIESQPRAKQSIMSSYFKDKSKSITFSDSSLSFGGFTTPDVPKVKGKSPAFNSDSGTSAERSNQSNVSKPSTMDLLNTMSGSKEDSSSAVKNGNSRFAFLRSTNKNPSLFVSTLKQRMENKKVGVSKAFAASADLDIVDSDDEVAWLETTSPINAHQSFKKPADPSTRTTPVSRHSTPLAARKNDYESSSNSPTPERPPPPRKRSKLKRKIFADEFIDREAEVSGDEGEDDYEDECSITSQLDNEMASFIDDDNDKPSNMTNYLKSIKSPENSTRKFFLPELSDSRLKVNVCSQMDYCDQSYENDSFCVDAESESEANDYIPSVLTQMETKLEQKRKSKNCVKSTKRTFKRIVQNFSSPDSPQTQRDPSPLLKRKSNKNILFSDSD